MCPLGAIKRMPVPSKKGSKL